jgi:hypothetical protein
MLAVPECLVLGLAVDQGLLPQRFRFNHSTAKSRLNTPPPYSRGESKGRGPLRRRHGGDLPNEEAKPAGASSSPP